MARHLYEFGPYILDVLTRRLTRDGEPITLTPKALDALIALLDQRDRVVGKTELMKVLWPDSYVEEANVTQTIFMLRKALGDAPDGRQYIDTISRRGYRFAANVRETCEGIPGAAADTKSTRSVKGIFTRRLAVAAIVVFGLGAGAGYFEWRSKRNADAATATTARSIAVLPFQRLGPAAADDEYLGLGMADALITQLGNVRQLTVRPTAAVKRYVDPSRDPARAGRELGVEWVLDGSIQRTDDRLRATVQLIRVRDGAPVWADRFDVPWTDVLTVQDSIASDVARALAPRLTAGEAQQLAKRYTRSPRAYERYLRSRFFWNKRTAEGFQQAIEYARQAIDEDPTYALAYSALADSYTLLGSIRQDVVPRAEAMTKAREAALRALSLDDRLAEAHTSLAFVLMHYDWNWTDSEREFKRAIEFNPAYPTAHHWYSIFLSAQQRHAEAIAEMHKAHEIDPLSLIITTDLAEAYRFARRYNEAIAYAGKALEIDPGFDLAHVALALSMVELGRYDEAIAEATRVPSPWPGGQGVLVIVLARAGRVADARKALHAAGELSQSYGASAWLVAPHAAVGEIDQAFAWMQRAYAERDGALILLNTEQSYAPLRHDPRFAEFARRVGLTPSPPRS